MNQQGTHHGRCFCGEVGLTVTGEPVGLPRQKDVPAELGGSGEVMRE